MCFEDLKPRASLGQDALDGGHKLKRLHVWWVVASHQSLRVDQELGEVPRDFLRESCPGVVELGVGSEVAVEYMSVGTVDLDFGEEQEIHAEIAPYEVLYFLLAETLLFHELIAREGENLKTLIAGHRCDAIPVLIV
jgi:hypothetical protein